MLGWTALALAKKAVVPIFTLEWIEGDGKITSSDRKALAAIQSETRGGRHRVSQRRCAPRAAASEKAEMNQNGLWEPT